MNSRQKRKLQAVEHNDGIRYSAWLKANAIYSRVSLGSSPVVDEYRRARDAGLTRAQAINIIALMSVAGIL